jgi:hypothetical protein
MNELCTRVHQAIRDAGLLGIVRAEKLVYGGGKEGVRVTIDFPHSIIEQMKDLDLAQG